MTNTEEIFEKLIAFPTVSRESNLEMIGYIQSYLRSLDIDSSLSYNDENTKANLYAVFGPEEVPGVMLSGHTDVVPIDGQNWTVDPFKLTLKGQRFYGRGTTDMKGFIASVLAMIPYALKKQLVRPIHLAFSYDEEVGCIGVRRLIDILEPMSNRPAFCVIGEPTEMEVAVAHKGKTAATCICRGVEAHSALTPKGLNAIYLACEMIEAIRQKQEEIKDSCDYDYHYEVPYTTLHVGTIEGGTALNIIPNECRFKFEIRNLGVDSPDNIIDELRESAVDILDRYRDDFPQADITIDVFNQYPALNTSPEEDVVKFVQSLVESDKFGKLAFGTEGGLFQQRLDIPTVVCGPGSMDQGHKPDEYIERSELSKCDQMLVNLIDRISA